MHGGIDPLINHAVTLAALGQLQAPSGEGGVLTQYLEQGGGMMYVILGVSLLGVTLFCERAFNLFVLRRLGASRFLAKVVEHLEARRFRQALDACAAPTRHPLVKVVQAGILRANRKDNEVERAMEREMLVALPGIQARSGALGLLANISTLLGLLGTIFGLITAFTSVAAATAAARQEALAGGISQAMYTTAFGISVAVPLLLFHHIISRRTETILVEVESGATAVLVALATARSADEAAAPEAPAAAE